MSLSDLWVHFPSGHHEVLAIAVSGSSIAAMQVYGAEVTKEGESRM